MRTKVLLAAVLLVALPRTARAADWYVDPSAGAAGDGSQGNPFATINDVLPGLARGDTIWLASGTYSETVNFAKLPGSSGQTTLRALPGATPVIDGTSTSANDGFVLQSEVPDMTFQDLTIQNAMGGALGIQFYYADGGQVLNCVTKNMSSNAVTFYYSSQGVVRGSTLQGNIGGRKTTGTVVEQNEVYGSGAEGIGLYNGSTGCTISHNVVHDNYSVNIYLDSISHSTIDGNLIYETASGNDLEGIEFSDEYYKDLDAPVNSYNTVINNVIVNHNIGIAFWYSGLWPTDALNQQSGLRYDVISNNTLVNNTGSMKWDASPAHVGTTIENNILVAAAGTSPLYLLQANSSNGVSLDHNLWYAPDLPQPFLWVSDQTDHAGLVTASGECAGDVLGDPLFSGPWAAPPATDLALTAGSPAIHAGATLPAVPDDYLGAARPSSGYDIGAFQYGAIASGGAGGSGSAGSPASGGAGSPASSGSGGSGGSSAGSGSAGSSSDAGSKGTSGSSSDAGSKGTSGSSSGGAGKGGSGAAGAGGKGSSGSGAAGEGSSGSGGSVNHGGGSPSSSGGATAGAGGSSEDEASADASSSGGCAHAPRTGGGRGGLVLLLGSIALVGARRRSGRRA